MSDEELEAIRTQARVAFLERRAAADDVLDNIDRLIAEIKRLENEIDDRAVGA